jgi:hypothetical protein
LAAKSRLPASSASSWEKRSDRHAGEAMSIGRDRVTDIFRASGPGFEDSEPMVQSRLQTSAEEVASFPGWRRLSERRDLLLSAIHRIHSMLPQASPVPGKGSDCRLDQASGADLFRRRLIPARYSSRSRVERCRGVEPAVHARTLTLTDTRTDTLSDALIGSRADTRIEHRAQTVTQLL